jgi:outer membrane protein assembly factor BamA
VRLQLVALAVLAAAGVARADPPTPGTLPASAQVAEPPPGALARWLDPATAPFIPIPEIDTEPHAGLTLGLIPTWLRNNSRDEIERIIAPDVIHSQYFGWGARMRELGFPSADTQWSVVGGLKQRVEREFDAQYLDGQTRTGPVSWTLEAIYDRSGIPRFFGIGNQTLHRNETSYLDNQGRLDVSLGRNFSPTLQLAYVASLRTVSVLPGVLRGVPSIETLFPGLKGLGNEHLVQQGAALTRDTRDSPIIPGSGSRYIVYAGFVSRALGSSVSYTYFGVEARHYWALGNEVTLAWHAAARYMPSAANAPFWALSSLGGDRSESGAREPLRDDGTDRYIDRNLFASGMELRTRVATFDAFRTQVRLEVAPFLDAGKVFANLGASPLSHLHTAAGFGVRGVASPFVVGYLDIGYGRDRAAVFSGIAYPF